MCGARNQRFLLLYGTQNGQAQAIAEVIGEQAEGHGFLPDIFSLQDLSSFSLETERDPVVIVISTTGTGEPPDPAVKFVKTIQNKELPGDHLSHVRYGLLALGDSEYTYFCNGGKVVDRRLQDLGAKRFYHTGYADDCVGLELTVEPWIEGLWGALKKECISRLENKVDDYPVTVNQSDPTTLDLTDQSLNLKAADAVVENPDVDSKPTAIDKHLQGSAGNLDLGNHSPTLKDTTSEEKHAVIMDDTKAMASHEGSQSTAEIQEAEVLPCNLKCAASEAITEKPMGHGEIKVNDINQSLQSTSRSLELGLQFLNLNGAITDTNFENKNLKADVEAKANKNCSQSTAVNLEVDGLPIKSSFLDAASGVEWHIVHSVPPLSQSSLTVPSLPPPYLDVLIKDCEGKEPDLSSLYPGEQVFQVPVSQSKCLTAKGSLKTALMLELDIMHTDIDFQPGDAFRVICPNPPEEVLALLSKLGLANKRSCQVSLSVRSDTKKRGASIPDFIPKECSLQFILTWCLEIRVTPKKALLRALVECTSDAAEKRRLQELSSKQGGADYNRFIREPALSILELLTAFPSCQPSLGLLMEHLPKLQARPYSAANSSLFLPGKLCIVFNVVEFPPCLERPMPKRGVCTGWLADLVKGSDTAPQICILGRPSTAFHLPSDTSIPIVMVGPGTGIAPFIGFLQHREKLCQQNTECVFGEAWLFFGCRSHNDYLFQEELSRFVENGYLTHLKVCFSRELPNGVEENHPRYVQDSLKMCSRDIVRLLIKEKGCLYVCGDAKNMAKDVNNALLDIFSAELCVDKLEAMEIAASLREHKQYLQDIWS